MLSIVRDLNVNIYQAAVSLAEEWEKLESLQHWSNEYRSHFSTPRPRPAGPQQGPREFDFSSSVASLLPGSERNFELGS